MDTRHKVMRRLFLSAGVALLMWLIAVGCLAMAMRQPPEQFSAVMKHVPMPAMMVLPFETLWKDARKGTLSIGDAAPDFLLETVDHSQRISLSSLRGKPVVLVFGSYT